MNEPKHEYCSACDKLTGHAGSGDGSIYVCDGAIGPLCDECYSLIRSELLEDAYSNLVDMSLKLAKDVGFMKDTLESIAYHGTDMPAAWGSSEVDWYRMIARDCIGIAQRALTRKENA